MLYLKHDVSKTEFSPFLDGTYKETDAISVYWDQLSKLNLKTETESSRNYK
jgi:hypothetical protein